MKKVTFSDNNLVHITYSKDEYSRACIDHVLYRLARKEITQNDINGMYVTLDLYKLYDMPVHSDSFKNNSYYVKKIILN
jgi:hypothetical protein